MKRLRYGAQSWLVDDDAADAVMERAASLAKSKDAEIVTLNVLNEDKRPQVVGFLLGPATMMTVENIEPPSETPDNRTAVAALADSAKNQSGGPLSNPYDLELN